MDKTSARFSAVTAIDPAVDRTTLARGLTLLALVCMIASAVGFLPNNPYLILPTLLMLAGGGALIGALRLRPAEGMPKTLPVIQAAAQARVRWIPLLVGIGLLALLGLRGGKEIISPLLFNAVNIHMQALLLVMGTALVVSGAGGLHRADLGALRVWLNAHRREALLVLALLLVAFAVRMVHVGDGVKAFMDEGPFVWAIVNMRRNPLLPFTAPMHPTASSTYLFPYTQLVLSEWFGSNLTVFRMGAVLYGALTVGATYALGRLLFDRRVALIAGVLLAVLPPHIHMSRIGIYNIADPLFGVLALVSFVYAIRTRRRLFYALAGAMLGLLPYAYEAGELLFPPLVLLWAGWLALNGRTRPALRGLGWMLLVALLVSLPVYYTSLSYGLPLFSRMDDASSGGNYIASLLISPNGFEQLGTYLNDDLLPPLLHFVHSPDPSLFYNGLTALILPWLVPLFLLGLFHALGRPRAGGLLLVLWALLTALGNSLILYNNWTPRFVVVMPAIALLCAAGLRYTLPLLNMRSWTITKALLMVLAVSQLVYYFGFHLGYYNRQILGLRRHYDVVYRTRELPLDTIVYFNYDDPVQVPFTYSLLEYLGDEHVFHAERFQNYDFTNLDPERSYAFFLNARDRDSMGKLEALWYLDGPYYNPRSGLTEVKQYELYLATPWLRKDREANSP